MTGTIVSPAELAGRLTELIGDRAAAWDRDRRLPPDLIEGLRDSRLLAAQIPAGHGGLGLDSAANGELTAHAGTLCGSVRSLLTSHGMAAWTVQRMGSEPQRSALLPALARGWLAAVGFSEPDAGSDLAAMTTRLHRDGDTVTVDGQKVWVTGARYADQLLIFGRYADGAAAALVPADAPGVTIEPVAEPLGCRAAGHATVRLARVEVPADRLLGGAGLPVDWLVTPALSYGRLSVAWGCVGMIRGCLRAACRHAATRRQFGQPLAGHQLIARHLTEMLLAEQAATRCCEHASATWDAGSPELATAVVLAKQLAATGAAATAAAAVQVLGSAGADDGSLVARAYRDAKLMEIIEGSTEICQLLLAKHALAVWS
jgi:methoxymalonate biosynthesis protein